MMSRMGQRLRGLRWRLGNNPEPIRSVAARSVTAFFFSIRGGAEISGWPVSPKKPRTQDTRPCSIPKVQYM